MDRLRIRDYTSAAKALENIGSGGALTVPGGGGDWSGDTKRSTIDAVKGVLRSSFEGPIQGDDLGSFGYASQLETILGNSLVEQQLFDCKQGFLILDHLRAFDDGSLHKIAKTLSAMANSGQGAVGYVAVGIADTAKDAQRVKDLDGIDAILYRGFRIVGIDREAPLIGKDINDYWHWIVQKLGASGLEASLVQGITASARLVAYHGRAVGLLKVVAPSAPNFFEGEIFERSGSDTVLVPKDQYVRVFQSF